MKTIFLSYSQKDSELSDELYTEFERYPDLKVIRDKDNLKHQDNLMTFMESIRDGDYAVIIISQAYLTSENCMRELSHLVKEKNFIQKAIFVLTDHSIYKEKNKDDLYAWWNQRIEDLSSKIQESEAKGHDAPVHLSDSRKLCREIRGNLDVIVKHISEHFLKTISELKKSNFAELIEKFKLEVLPKIEKNNSIIIKGFDSDIRIIRGIIKYEKSNTNQPFLSQLRIMIVGGKVFRDPQGRISALIETLSPYGEMQELNEKIGLSTFEVYTSEPNIVIEEGKTYNFSGSSQATLPANVPILNLATWENTSLPVPVNTRAHTKLSGLLTGTKFQGKFVGKIQFSVQGLTIPDMILEGSFEVELS